MKRATGRSSPWAVTSRPRCVARRTRANRVRAGLSALTLVLPLLNAPSISLPLSTIPLPVIRPSLAVSLLRAPSPYP